MAADLTELRALLRDGHRLSKQGSYNRRAPARKALPYLKKAVSGLEAVLDTEPGNTEAWRMLSSAKECLLEYPAALQALERAVELEGKSGKKDLKKLVLLRELAGEWAALGLTPAQVKDLGRYLKRCGVERGGQGHDLTHTTAWLREKQIPDPDKVLEALKNAGGYDDAEVLWNVVLG